MKDETTAVVEPSEVLIVKCKNLEVTNTDGRGCMTKVLIDGEPVYLKSIDIHIDVEGVPEVMIRYNSFTGLFGENLKLFN